MWARARRMNVGEDGSPELQESLTASYRAAMKSSAECFRSFGLLGLQCLESILAKWYAAPGLRLLLSTSPPRLYCELARTCKLEKRIAASASFGMITQATLKLLSREPG